MADLCSTGGLRICVAKVVTKDRCIFAISAYAPKLTTSEKYPEQRDEFYDQPDNTVNDIASRNIMLILGDFNAKTNSGWSEFPGNMGKFGKGLINSSGRILLEFLTKQDPFLTNTIDLQS